MEQSAESGREVDPIEAIQRVFARLAATYGAEWFRNLGATPIADVKTVWVHELGGFLRNRDTMMAIAWALNNLPEQCPNAVVFRNLCRQAPQSEAPRLEVPRADPQRVAAELAKLAPLRKGCASATSSGSSKAWARKLLERKAAGESVTPGALAMARSALGPWGHDGQDVAG